MTKGDRNIVLKGALLAAEVAAQREPKPRVLYRVLVDATTDTPTLHTIGIIDVMAKKFEVPRCAATNYHSQVPKNDERFAFTPGGAWAAFAHECEVMYKSATDRARRAAIHLDACEQTLSQMMWEMR